jgi:hypothetical protein
MNYNLVSQSFELNIIIFKLYKNNSGLSLETEQKTTSLTQSYDQQCLSVSVTKEILLISISTTFSPIFVIKYYLVGTVLCQGPQKDFSGG